MPDQPAPLADAEPIAREVGKLIGPQCPPGWGFCLILFTFGEGGHMTYVSNAHRDDMVATLKELVGKMEAERYRE